MADTWAIMPARSEAMGLDMPAWIRGSCVRIAAVRAEPERGSKKMKWYRSIDVPTGLCAVSSSGAARF